MDKQEQKKLLVEIMEADQKDGLYKQQTAVEWLVDQIKRDQNQKALTASEWAEVIEQAKEMEWEQMVDFAEFVATHSEKNKNYLGEILHAKSKYDGAERTIDLLEQYYDETAKNK